MQDLNCIVVEDEPLAARILEDYIQQTKGISHSGTAEDAATAVKLTEEQDVKILFVDINLPSVNGLDLIRNLDKKYCIILTTAYHQFAVEGLILML